MKMTPKERYRKDYEKYRKGCWIRSTLPTICWHKCGNCGNEYRRESMWEVQEPSVHFAMTTYHKFCKHCFPTKDEVVKHAEKNVLLKPEDFDTSLRENETKEEYKERLLSFMWK